MTNLKQKLTSRKLWAAIAAAAITIVTALFEENLTVEQVGILSKGVVALCCYIFGEGIVDAARHVGSKLLEGLVIEEVIEESEDEE